MEGETVALRISLASTLLSEEPMATTASGDDLVVVDSAWVGQGAIAGLIGGAFFLAFQMLAAAVTMGAAWAAFPLRMIAGILLGPGAIDPGSPIAVVSIAGGLTHATLAAAFGVLYASIVPRRARRSATAMVARAVAYGIGLWIVNVYAIAFWAGWPWFLERTTPLVQLVAHALYAIPVGLYLHDVEARSRLTVTPPIEQPLRRAA